MDIIKLSKLGESKSLEFKRNTESLPSILKTIIAFANTVGGIILIGVDDDGVIVGVDEPNSTQDKLANSITNRIRPQLNPDIHVIDVGGLNVIAIQVEGIKGMHYLQGSNGEKKVYIRIGSCNQIASPETISELIRDGNYASFDLTPCDGVKKSDLDIAKINDVFTRNGRTIDDAKLVNIGVLTKKGSNFYSTNGGVILFGLPEIRQRYFPYAEVRCARFKGTSRAEFIDRLNIEGGVLEAIYEVPKFIRRNTKMAGKFGEMRRRDIPEYPVEGIREALTNAIAHANYEVSGSRIFVAIYDDRLEIQNPGIMPSGMSVEQFMAGVSKIRNPVIARTLRELELVEEWGSGYKRIKDSCEEGGYPLPMWEEFGTALRVTFYPHSEISTELDASLGTKSAPSRHQVGSKLELTEEELQLIDFCRKSKSMQEMLEYMGLSDRTKFTRRIVMPMIDSGLIARTIPEKPNSSKQRYVTTDDGFNVLSKVKNNIIK